MDGNGVLNTNENEEGIFLDKKLMKKRAIIYLAFVYCFVFIGWIFSVILPEPSNKKAYGILILIFSLFPFLSNILTRVITKDKSPL